MERILEWRIESRFWRGNSLQNWEFRAERRGERIYNCVSWKRGQGQEKEGLNEVRERAVADETGSTR